MVPRLRGRDGVLRAIGQVLNDACSGRGRVVFVTGEPGIGKTSVAAETVRLARDRDMDVAWGACLDADLASPFAPWLEILGPEAVAAIAPCSGSAIEAADPREAEWRRFLAFHTVVAELRSRAAAKGLLVVLEDLHWAGIPAQLLVRYVAAHLGAVGRVLLVGTFRHGELDPAAPLALLMAGADRLALGGLEESAVAEVVADLTGESIGAGQAAKLHRATGGNPFFVTQLARLGVDSAVRVPELAVPSEVKGVLSRRLDPLDASTRRVLGAAAVLGEQFDGDVVAEILAAGPEVVVPAFEAGERAGVVQRTDAFRGWRFVHILFRHVCGEELGLLARREVHERAASVFEERAADPSAVAFHLHRADLPADDVRPARADVAAGAAALGRLAWEDAAGHFQRALATMPTAQRHDELRVESLLGLGAARLRAGDSDAAGKAFDSAARVAEARGWPDVLARAALGFGAGLGGFEVRMLDQRQVDLLERAAALVSAESPLRPWILARLSVALSFMGAEERRLALADEAVALARRSGDSAALAAALASRCDAVAGPDQVSERLGAATEIVSLARQAGDRALELLGRRLRVVALAELGSMADVDDEIAAFDRVASVHGDPLYRWYVPLWQGMRALSRGELADAERWAAEALEVGSRSGSANALVLSEMLWFVLLVDRRSTAAADRFRRLASRHPELVGPAGLPMFVWVLASVGEVAEAGRHLAAVRANGIERLPRDGEWLPVMTQLAEAAVVLADRSLAAEVRQQLEPYRRLCVVEGIGAAVRGSVARPLALLAALLGDRRETLARLEQARSVDDAIGALLGAHTRHAAARALCMLGEPADRQRARQEAREAANAYRRMGLDALAADAEALASETTPSPAQGVTTWRKAALRREGQLWAVTWDGTTARVRHGKGIADLAVLLARPGVEIHVRELAANVGEYVPTGSTADARLDRRAVAEYRMRLAELDLDVADAEDAADVERAARLRVERDFLVSELSGALGLGGRPRPGMGDVDDRLRKAVSARIRDSLRRLDEVHPAAANHLRHSIRTGSWCTYEPEHPIRWEVEPG